MKLFLGFQLKMAFTHYVHEFFGNNGTILPNKEQTYNLNSDRTESRLQWSSERDKISIRAVCHRDDKGPATTGRPL